MSAYLSFTNNKNKTKETNVNVFGPQLFSFCLSSLLVIASIGFSSQANSQETRYIRDTLFVPLRSGQSFKHRIVHKGLMSGTPLTLLEVSEDESYSFVKTEQGIEGWLQSQYLSDEPSARSQLKNLQAQNQKLQTQNTALAKELGNIKKQYSEAQVAVSQLSEKQQGTSKELNEIKEISANALTLNDDNKQLLQKNQELLNEVDLLKADNQRLNDSIDNEAFMNGALAVLIGVIITLLVPRLWPRKSSEWS